MSKLKAYCELIRLPNLFTAAADILAGYFLVTREVSLSGTLLLLIAASCCLYAAGIVINDIHDLETDRRERPARPLPSGRIPFRAALRLALSLPCAGILAATWAWSPTAPWDAVTLENRTGLIALALTAAMLAYNLLLKPSPLGPIAMGLCRALNLALPISIVRVTGDAVYHHLLMVIVAFGLYVASFTYFGRDEAGVIHRRRLIGGLMGVVIALFAIGIWSIAANDLDSAEIVLWLAIMIHLARIGLRAVRQPSPVMVQYAMRTFILGIIGVDAVIAGATAGLSASLVTLALLIPAATLGRWVYST